MDSKEARLSRDVAIGCAARLDGCARLIRATFRDPQAHKCLLACGHAVVGLGAVIDTITRSFPELAPTDAEWARIELELGGGGDIELDGSPRARLLLDIGAVEDRVLSIRAMTSELAPEVSAVLTRLGKLAKVIDRAWVVE